MVKFIVQSKRAKNINVVNAWKKEKALKNKQVISEYKITSILHAIAFECSHNAVKSRIVLS